MFLRRLSILLFVFSLLIAQTDRKGIAPGPDRILNMNLVCK